MVDKMNMTLFQLRTYKAWIERDRDAFVAEYPKVKRDATNAKMSWYEKELNDVNYWVDVKENKLAREEMEAKAEKFLYPQPVRLTGIKNPSGFKLLKLQIQDFFYRMEEAFRGK